MVEDNRAFNSGEPVINSNFLYTFEQEGLNSVISYGADGYYCLINVMQEPRQTEVPKLVNNEPYIVDKYHAIHLSTPTPDAKIYYTTNGMQPNKQSAFLKVYWRNIKFSKKVSIYNIFSFIMILTELFWLRQVLAL